MIHFTLLSLQTLDLENQTENKISFKLTQAKTIGPIDTRHGPSLNGQGPLLSVRSTTQQLEELTSTVQYSQFQGCAGKEEWLFTGPNMLAGQHSCMLWGLPSAKIKQNKTCCVLKWT